MRKAHIAVVLLALASCDREGGAESAPVQGAPRVETGPAPVADTAPEPTAAEPGREPSGDTAPAVAQGEPEELVPPEPEGPPPGHGQIKPSASPPDPSALTVHALAGYEVVPVYDKPDIESAKLGYLRIGQRLMVTEQVEGAGCPGGWYQTAEGTYACAGRRGGLQVDAKKPPYLFKAPPEPRRDEPFPYDYAYIRKWNTPMWWRIPTAEERAEANRQRAILEAQREGTPLPGEEPVVDAASPAKPSDDGFDPQSSPASKQPVAKALPGVDDDVVPASAAQKPADPEIAAAEPLEEPPAVKLPLSPGKPWLEKGFFIALAEKEVEDGMAWYRTARGAYVQAGNAGGTYDVKDFQGAALGEDQDFPFGFAMLQKKPAKVYELTEDGKLQAVGKLEYRTFVDLSEETEIDGKAYMLTTEGNLILKHDLRLAERQPVPEGLEPWEGWIDVDLSLQMLVAYEGERPVYVTLVSTGKKGTKEEPFDTPTGRWRIRTKHTTTTMDGTAGEGNYSIQDVPWAQYFKDNIALHAAFWHEGFGRVRSHGCVNLGATDARWLFHWTTPYLPRGWHGVHAHEGSPGTTVVVHD